MNRSFQITLGLMIGSASFLFTASKVLCHPSNWRTYKKGSAWLFGLDTFAPLRWYWRNLKWPDQPGAEDEISWLELALDFHAATHCSLAMPGFSQYSSNAAQMAHFFLQPAEEWRKFVMVPRHPVPKLRTPAYSQVLGWVDAQDFLSALNFC